MLIWQSDFRGWDGKSHATCNSPRATCRPGNTFTVALNCLTKICGPCVVTRESRPGRGFRFGNCSLNHFSEGKSGLRYRVFSRVSRVKGTELSKLLEKHSQFSSLSDDDVVRVCLLLALNFVFMDRSQFCEEGPNDDRVSDVEEVSKTNFGDNSSISINHIDELEKQQSQDPFNIYRLLRKQPGDESHEVSSSLSHPPGFTPDISVIRNENGQSAKEIPVVVNAKIMNNSQDVYKHASCDNVDLNVVKKGGSVLGVMADMIRVGKAMGYSMDGCDNWVGDGLLHLRYNRLFHLDSNANFFIKERIADEALDIEDNVDSSFGRKRLCIKTKLPLSILKSFKVNFKGKLYMVQAKELFTWSLIFLGQKEMEYTSDEDSDVGPQKVPDRSQFCEDGPNDDRVSDVEEVSETNFGDNSSIPINHIDELEKQQSEDPFNIYRLLRKQPGDESHE
nr:hypothetical protein [Tanacetum cinerariifolium]